jgi:hypothetical protein
LPTLMAFIIAFHWCHYYFIIIDYYWYRHAITPLFSLPLSLIIIIIFILLLLIIDIIID